MDTQLYMRVKEIADGLSAIEEKQNQKLDEVLKKILELNTMVSVLIKSFDKPPKEVTPEMKKESPKVEVKKAKVKK